MTVSIDPLFGRKYDINTYNCVHFLCDAWLLVTGENLSERMHDFLCAVSAMHPTKQGMRQFKRLPKPISPCIVLMRNSTHSHVGLFYEGRVLHLDGGGVQWLPLNIVTFGFARVRFYQ